MVKVHVLAGGDSPERDVSLRSGTAVASALTAAGFDVVLLDPSRDAMETIVACDVVFPVLHGVGGEDGTLQAELEKHAARFVGSNSASSALCMEKSQYKQLIAAHRLPTPDSALVTAEGLKDHPLTQKPFVLKPYAGGSSVDTFIVRDVSAAPWDRMLETLRDNYEQMLIEQLIDGVELTVGVLGEVPLPIIEIIPPENAEFDYENKYNGATQELCPPQYVSEEVQQEAQALALQAHQISGCRDFSRTDIMCDSQGSLFILETNTIPGMTDQSLFPKMAATAGIPMPELCRQLVDMALSR